MSEFQSILPPNHTPVEAALEKAVWMTKPDLTSIRKLLSPEQCPVEYLDWLAWALSVDEWNLNWSEERKREVLRATLDIHRRKGVIGAVRKAVAAFGFGPAEIIERFGWETHNGQFLRDGSIARHLPDHWAEYRVRLTRPITVEQAATVREVLGKIAPARCHLRALEFPQDLHLHDNKIHRDGTYTRGTA